MKKLLVLLPLAAIALLSASPVLAQADLEKAFTDKGSYKDKAMAKAPRRAYIKEFSVYFQVLAAAEDRSKAGGNRATVSGATRTTMGVGLDGPSMEQLQGMTNELYSAYTGQLTAAGFTLVDGDEVEKTETLGDWTRFAGGEVASAAQVGGYLAFTPAGADLFYRKETASGKTKGSFLIANDHRVSRDLEDAVVISVSLVVPFVLLEAGTTINASQMGSKIKAKINLELATAGVEQEVKNTGKLVASFQQPD